MSFDEKTQRFIPEPDKEVLRDMQFSSAQYPAQKIPELEKADIWFFIPMDTFPPLAEGAAAQTNRTAAQQRGPIDRYLNPAEPGQNANQSAITTIQNAVLREIRRERGEEDDDGAADIEETMASMNLNSEQNEEGEEEEEDTESNRVPSREGRRLNAIRDAADSMQETLNRAVTSKNLLRITVVLKSSPDNFTDENLDEAFMHENIAGFLCQFNTYGGGPVPFDLDEEIEFALIPSKKHQKRDEERRAAIAREAQRNGLQQNAAGRGRGRGAPASFNDGGASDQGSGGGRGRGRGKKGSTRKGFSDLSAKYLTLCEARDMYIGDLRKRFSNVGGYLAILRFYRNAKHLLTEYTSNDEEALRAIRERRDAKSAALHHSQHFTFDIAAEKMEAAGAHQDFCDSPNWFDIPSGRYAPPFNGRFTFDLTLEQMKPKNLFNCKFPHITVFKLTRESRIDFMKRHDSRESSYTASLIGGARETGATGYAHLTSEERSAMEMRLDAVQFIQGAGRLGSGDGTSSSLAPETSEQGLSNTELIRKSYDFIQNNWLVQSRRFEELVVKKEKALRLIPAESTAANDKARVHVWKQYYRGLRTVYAHGMDLVMNAFGLVSGLPTAYKELIKFLDDPENVILAHEEPYTVFRPDATGSPEDYKLRKDTIHHACIYHIRTLMRLSYHYAMPGLLIAFVIMYRASFSTCMFGFGIKPHYGLAAGISAGKSALLNNIIANLVSAFILSSSSNLGGVGFGTQSGRQVIISHESNTAMTNANPKNSSEMKAMELWKTMMADGPVAYSTAFMNPHGKMTTNIHVANFTNTVLASTNILDQVASGVNESAMNSRVPVLTPMADSATLHRLNALANSEKTPADKAFCAKFERDNQRMHALFMIAAAMIASYALPMPDIGILRVMNARITSLVEAKWPDSGRNQTARDNKRIEVEAFIETICYAIRRTFFDLDSPFLQEKCVPGPNGRQKVLRAFTNFDMRQQMPAIAKHLCISEDLSIYLITQHIYRLTQQQYIIILNKLAAYFGAYLPLNVRRNKGQGNAVPSSPASKNARNTSRETSLPSTVSLQSTEAAATNRSRKRQRDSNRGGEEEEERHLDSFDDHEEDDNEKEKTMLIRNGDDDDEGMELVECEDEMMYKKVPRRRRQSSVPAPKNLERVPEIAEDLSYLNPHELPDIGYQKCLEDLGWGEIEYVEDPDTLRNHKRHGGLSGRRFPLQNSSRLETDMNFFRAVVDNCNELSRRAEGEEEEEENGEREEPLAFSTYSVETGQDLAHAAPRSRRPLPSSSARRGGGENTAEGANVAESPRFQLGSDIDPNRAGVQVIKGIYKLSEPANASYGQYKRRGDIGGSSMQDRLLTFDLVAMHPPSYFTPKEQRAPSPPHPPQKSRPSRNAFPAAFHSPQEDEDPSGSDRGQESRDDSELEPMITENCDENIDRDNCDDENDNDEDTFSHQLMNEDDRLEEREERGEEERRRRQEEEEEAEENEEEEGHAMGHASAEDGDCVDAFTEFCPSDCLEVPYDGIPYYKSETCNDQDYINMNYIEIKGSILKAAEELSRIIEMDFKTIKSVLEAMRTRTIRARYMPNIPREGTVNSPSLHRRLMSAHKLMQCPWFVKRLPVTTLKMLIDGGGCFFLHRESTSSDSIKIIDKIVESFAFDKTIERKVVTGVQEPGSDIGYHVCHLRPRTGMKMKIPQPKVVLPSQRQILEEKFFSIDPSTSENPGRASSYDEEVARHHAEEYHFHANETRMLMHRTISENLDEMFYNNFINENFPKDDNGNIIDLFVRDETHLRHSWTWAHKTLPPVQDCSPQRSEMRLLEILASDDRQFGISRVHKFSYPEQTVKECQEALSKKSSFLINRFHREEGRKRSSTASTRPAPIRRRLNGDRDVAQRSSRINVSPAR